MAINFGQKKKGSSNQTARTRQLRERVKVNEHKNQNKETKKKTMQINLTMSSATTTKHGLYINLPNTGAGVGFQFN